MRWSTLIFGEGGHGLMDYELCDQTFVCHMIQWTMHPGS